MDVSLETPEGDILIKEPIKIAIASLAGCEAHTMNYFARKRNIKIDGLVFTDVSAVVDMEGFKGVEGHEADIKEVNMKVTVTSSADEASLKLLYKDVVDHCFIYHLFVKGGVKMNVEFKKAK